MEEGREVGWRREGRMGREDGEDGKEGGVERRKR